MRKVTAVSADDRSHLTLTFSHGERRGFDMQPYMHLPVFQRLQNPGFFALARVDYGTVVWSGEIDIAPETLYELSLPLDSMVA